MANSLAHKVFRAEQVRQWEPEAARQTGCDMFTLMLRAGEAAYKLLRVQWPEATRILVLTGHGNNGGDGFVLAQLAEKDGLDVSVCAFHREGKLQGDALRAQTLWQQGKAQTAAWQDIDIDQYDVVVDAMLGTGIKGEVRVPYAQVIPRLNAAQKNVLAIDIPSGIDADAGQIQGHAVRATHTLSYVGIKQGLVTGDGRQACGQRHFDDLGIGEAFARLTTASATLATLERCQVLPPRGVNSHKGDFGRLLCIGGNTGMAGAVRLCGEAALRTGAGLVKVCCHPDNVALVAGGRPELMVSADNLRGSLDWATCVVLGPGLGQSEWSSETFNQVVAYLQQNNKPLLIDADGLNLLATRQASLNIPATVLTPHPGEAARLLDCSITDIQQNRFQAARALQQKYQATVLLKGAGTLIDDGAEQWVCDQGNPGMATAGMGDVLSGVIAALLAQGLTSSRATVYGACLHAAAGDMVASDRGQRGMLASDLFSTIQQLNNR